VPNLNPLLVLTTLANGGSTLSALKFITRAKGTDSNKKGQYSHPALLTGASPTDDAEQGKRQKAVYGIFMTRDS
jgi:hypothetical protein